jgi:hypothetical protein
MCAWCVEQFIVPLNLGHTCCGSISQMTHLLNCPQNIMHPNHHSIWHLLAYPPICFKPQSCVVSLSHSLRGICSSWFVVNKKYFWVNPPTHYFVLVAYCSFAKPYNDGVTFCKGPTSPQLHMPMYTTSCLFVKKCNIMLSLDKLLCEILQWCTTFIMFMNAHANFTQFCLKVMVDVKFNSYRIFHFIITTYLHFTCIHSLSLL